MRIALLYPPPWKMPACRRSPRHRRRRAPHRVLGRRSRRRLLPDAVRPLRARRAGAPGGAPGQGHQPLGVPLGARRGGPRRARRRPLRHVLLDGEPPRRRARRARASSACHPDAHIVVGRPARHAAGARDARSPPRRSTPSRWARASGTFLELIDRLAAGPAHHGHRRARRTATARRRRLRRARPRARRHRGPRHPGVAARLLRHAHRDDLARLPLGAAPSAAPRPPGAAASAATR